MIVWVGLAEVRQRPGANVLLDRNDAFVFVLGLAHDDAGFQTVVEDALDELGFDLLRLENSEPFQLQMTSDPVREELIALAAEVAATGEARLGTFHTWTTND
ncbi:MAG: hypothetical protein M3Y05_15330 [Gemmatimonadota bacterium]|nr:hypothetical protein [Gemmatimonadota bacterium]